MATVKTETIHGVKVTFEVDSKGRFTCTPGDEYDEVSGSTLTEVEDKVTKILKKAKQHQPIEVTFLHISKGKEHSWSNTEYRVGDDAIDVTLRGYSPRTRDWLITEAGGKKAKVSKGYSDNGIVLARRLTPAEHAEWKRLQEARRAAVTAIEDFVGARKLDTKKWTEVE